ncbi:flavodoxin family protein [Streptococcus cuniculipharyngis]|uniref:Flavodoxin n=1 Tax=Streptococcus cuniculipharyngis TaxID=1562651 RepID=A0A5C5SFW1_9STRE|nr:flavodoxin [Streptococcus cuniculipharyngis]TWS98791.1 flavodoxin [Streptococcus cuniculipharyngis]
MRKSFILLVSVLVLAACAVQNNKTTSSSLSTSSSSVLPSGKMDQSRIAAPQVGLSDEEWNNSRGTVSDGEDTNSEQEPTRILSEDADSLIVYFSRSGSTEFKIQALSGADVIELVAKETYSSDYGETVQRANQERNLENTPELDVEMPDLSQYQSIYIGYPIWGMTMAEPVATFIEIYAKELDGKTIIPFSTNGGYGLGSSIDYIETVLAENQVTARIEPAFAVEGNKVDQADSDLMTWYDNLNK